MILQRIKSFKEYLHSHFKVKNVNKKKTNYFALKVCAGAYLELQNSLRCKMGDANILLLNQFFSLDYTCEYLPKALHNATTGCKLNKRHPVAITTKTGSNVMREI